MDSLKVVKIIMAIVLIACFTYTIYHLIAVSEIHNKIAKITLIILYTTLYITAFIALLSAKGIK